MQHTKNKHLGIARRLLAAAAIGLLFSSHCQSIALQCDGAALQKNSPVQMSYRVVKQHPHRSDAFTQGLLYREGKLYESTGRYGHSTLSRIDLEHGEVQQQHALSPQYFGEGLTLWRDQLIWLTWKSGKVFRYRAEDISPLTVQELPASHTDHSSPVEGWGITHNGEQLITSDGSAQLTFRHPETLAASRTVIVRYRDRPLKKLNELAWVDGCLLANIWQSPYIAVIDPDSGLTTALLDLSPLLKREQRLSPSAGVANGIAHLPEQRQLLVTGKNWQHIYQLKMLPP